MFGRWCEVEWLLEPRDMWIGLYWKRWPRAIEFYVCALPVLPLRVYVEWGK